MVTHKTPLLIILMMILYVIFLSNLWEDHDDLKEIDDKISSLDDLSLCDCSIHNYVVESTLDACKVY